MKGKTIAIVGGVIGAAWLANYITTKLDTVSKLNAFMVGLQIGKIRFANNQLLLDVKVKVRVTNGSNAAATATGFAGSFFATDGFTKLADFAVDINNATNSIVIPANGFNDVDIDATISVLDSLATYLQNAKEILLKATVTVNGIPIPIQQNVAVGCACDSVGAVPNVSYKDFHKYYTKFLSKLDAYAVKNNSVNGSFYLAKNLLSEMAQRASVDQGYNNKAVAWLKKGGTLKLKDLLSKTNYNDSLMHFNAMSLIDSIS